MIFVSMITTDARLWKAKEECGLIRGTKLTDYEARRVPLPKHALDILTKLQTEASEGVPFVLLNEQRYHTVAAKWQRFQQQGKEWQNSDMENNTLSNFKRCLK